MCRVASFVQAGREPWAGWVTGGDELVTSAPDLRALRDFATSSSPIAALQTRHRRRAPHSHACHAPSQSVACTCIHLYRAHDRSRQRSTQVENKQTNPRSAGTRRAPRHRGRGAALREGVARGSPDGGRHEDERVGGVPLDAAAVAGCGAGPAAQHSSALDIASRGHGHRKWDGDGDGHGRGDGHGTGHGRGHQHRRHRSSLVGSRTIQPAGRRQHVAAKQCELPFCIFNLPVSHLLFSRRQSPAA